MNKIGIMGGTFNPIHIGHLILAQWGLEEVPLDEIWLIPTGISYRKLSDELVSGQERLHMVKLAIQGNERFRCLDMEVRREGYTYSYETLEQLKGMYPKNDFFFIVGSDCLFSIENWKFPERIFNCCTLAAAVRGDTTLEAMKEKKRQLEMKFMPNERDKILLLPFMNMSVSSTLIRERIRDGKSVKYLVPDNVLEYMMQKGFYQ